MPQLPVTRRAGTGSQQDQNRCAMFDVGATWIRGLVARAGENELSSVGSLTLPTPNGAHALVDGLTASLARLSDSSTRPITDVRVAMPGIISSEGVVRFAGNLNIQNFDLKAALEKATGLPCVVVNDAKAQSLALLSSDRRTFLYVSMGTGIGGALVIDGSPLIGAGYAGEVGHIQVPNGHSRVACYCGRAKCLELFASGGALERVLGQNWWTTPKPEVDNALIEAGNAVGAALDIVQVTFFLSFIHIAGHLASYEIFRGAVENALRTSPLWPVPEVAWSEDSTALTYVGLSRIQLF